MLKIWHILTFDPIDSLKALIIVYKMTLLVLNRGCFHTFYMVNLFDPFDPYMTFEVKPLITLVATNPLVILTKLHDHAT